MKPVLCMILIAVMCGLVSAAEKETAGHKYDFTITDAGGQVLGKGTIALPFTFGSGGKGGATWEFTANEPSSTNRYWAKAKARLAKGRGDAKAACEDSWFTLNFNPDFYDNNVTVSWAINKEPSGNMCFDDYAGSHRFAFFKISQAKAQSKD